MSVTSYPTLTDVLLDRSSSKQSITFIAGQDQHTCVSLADLLGRAKLRLGSFQRSGLVAGSQLLIQCDDNALLLEAFWACILGGIIAVPVAVGNTSEQRHKLFRIAAKLNTPTLFTEAKTALKLKEFAEHHGPDGEYLTLLGGAIIADSEALLQVQGEIHTAQPDDIVFIQFSSGSTSTPKGVVLSHNNLIKNTESIIDGCLMTEDDHLLSWMPLTHDMGLIGFHLTPVVCNVSHSLIPTNVFVRRPSLWLIESANMGATILCSPNFGFQHLLKLFKPEKHSALDLSCVRLMFNGAEPISVSLCERFMRTLEPFKLDQNAMLPVYGLAEASLAVSIPSLQNRFSSLTVHREHLGVCDAIGILNDGDADFDRHGVVFVAVGESARHVSIEIHDNAGVALSSDVTGHVCIRGESVTRGYYEEPALNQAMIDPHGWLNTGDLGFLHDAQLYITGRTKELMFVNGQNVYPHDLEEILIQAELVERGKVVVASQRLDDAEEEQLLVFILHRARTSDLLETATAVTRHLSEAAGLQVYAVVQVKRIPKTTSGKVQRFLLLESLRLGELDVLIQPDIEDEQLVLSQGTAARLQVICQAQVAGRAIGIDDNLFDLGISSLTLAQIHAAIEEEWPDQVDITDLFDYPTITELAVLLDSKDSA